MKRGSARRLLLLGLSLVLFVVSRRASAEPARVLFVSPERTPFSTRIQAEIATMGIEVVPAASLDAEGVPPISAAARVVESPPPRRIELWLRDEKTGRLALDQVVEAEPGIADSTSAVRASEQLRAFFQPLGERAATAALMPRLPNPQPLSQTPRVTPPKQAVRAALPRTADEAQFFQELAGAIPVGPGSQALDLLVRARRRLGQNYAVGGKLVLPLVPSAVEFAGNSADVSASLFGAELAISALTTRVVSFGVHAGFGLLWLSASGKAQAPYTGRVEHRWAALPSVGSELAVRVTRHLRLCLGAELGVSVPRLQLSFAGQHVASWARPLALFSAGVGVEWGSP